MTGPSITFETLRRMGKEPLILSLPGRQERVCPPGDAIEWFIDCYEQWGGNHEVTLVEPVGAQKAMLPAVERWRLRQLVP